MFFSFTAVEAKFREKLQTLADKIKEETTLLEENGWCFLFKHAKTKKPLTDSFFSDDKSTYYVVGDVYNITELRALLLPYSSSVTTCNTAQLLSILYNNIGYRAFACVEGSFTLLISSCDKTLTLFTDNLGLCPVNFVFGETLWISSELKNIGLVNPCIFSFKKNEEIVTNVFRSDTFLPIHNGMRLKPGQMVCIKFDGNSYPYIQSADAFHFALNHESNIKKDVAIQFIDRLLCESLNNIIHAEQKIAISLSGGLDSSLVTALACKGKKEITTYSIGTEESNEFEYSSVVAQHLGTNHHQYIMTNKDIIKGIVESIYYTART